MIPPTHECEALSIVLQAAHQLPSPHAHVNACRPENATSTAGCLELLGAELEPLKRAQAEKGLLLQVRSCAP